MTSWNNFIDVLVSVVIPAFNEAEGIGHAIGEIQRVMDKSGVRYELIVVDDGSQDGTFETVRNLGRSNKKLKGMKLSRNFGKEAALLAGLEAAGGDAVITMDADLQHPPGLIPEMLAKWKEGFKVVHGRKRDRVSDNMLVRWRASAFNYMLSRLGGIDVQHSSDFKLLDRVVVDVIIRQLPEKRRFFRGLAGWVGFEQTEIPFSVVARKAGNGKWSMAALFELAATALVSFTTAPLRIVSVLGLVTLAFGMVVAADTLWSWFKGEAVSGYSTIIITLLILGSFIMISLGIVGEYIAKMYEEIKGRPPYLITARYGFKEDQAAAGDKFCAGEKMR
ncbi:MAG: glycosyltransferase family 2 protein [Nitrospiraceae bacterium]|nr:glycosyltransferase family 2 protein [Nitrospiraceae bacterium]